MNRTEKTDILVAGGGVAGLTAAAAFAAAGFDVICVDPAPPATTEITATSDLRSTAFLMPAIRLLEDAGLWQALKSGAAPLRVMRIADAGGTEAEIRDTADFSATELGLDTFGWNLPNRLLRAEMTAHLLRLPNADLRTGVAVDHVTPRSREAVVRLSDGAWIRASLVIAADGRDSAVRQGAGISARRWGYGQKALVLSVSHPRPHNDTSTEIHRTGGPFTLVPLPDHDGTPCSALVWMDTGPEIVRLAAQDDDAFTAALNARSCGVLGRLEPIGPRRAWPIITQVASRLDAARTALVAEAAHVVPPIGAQGLNMSLHDIATLRDLCVTARDSGQDIGSSDLLHRYHRTRRPDILARVTGIDILNRAAMQESRALRDLRLAGLRALYGAGPLRRAVMKLGLGVSG